MSDNVIIFGAGASHTAGIPLIAGFVQTMWEFAITGRASDENLSHEDQMLFVEAMKIKDELDTYHGRAMFDDRNLEDILSILSFNEMSGKKGSKKKLSIFLKAISRTIDLTCRVKHDGEIRIQKEGPHVYRDFWIRLISSYERKRQFPTIITFNYDLVLERAFFQVLNNVTYKIQKVPFSSVYFNYHYDRFDQMIFSVESAQYIVNNNDLSTTEGTCLKPNVGKNPIPIEIIKLHGSVNFSNKKNVESCSLVKPVDEPLIMPPIFSKMAYGQSLDNAWAEALRRLRQAKNVIIVGYSLPRTDIYMQYFLKSALGPNVNLNAIYVFDPVLFSDNEASKEMINRYASCFSPQLKSRIIFNPEGGEKSRGSFSHFVRVILNKPGILF